jgi:hypothetical protein
LVVGVVLELCVTAYLPPEAMAAQVADVALQFHQFCAPLLVGVQAVLFPQMLQVGLRAEALARVLKQLLLPQVQTQALALR